MKTLTQLAASIERRMREFAAVDLGKSNGYGGCCDMPSPSPSYPTLYVSGREDSKLSDIPAKGKAVIEYRLRSKTVNYGQDGKESHSSDIEVQSIDPQTNLEAALARHELARGDQLASMIGAKVVPLRKGDKLADDLAGRMRKVRGIDKVKKPALRAVLEPNRQKILKGMRGDVKHVKAVREADFKEAREIWDGSIGTRLPRGAVKDGRRAYGLEAKRLARVLDAMAHDFGSAGFRRLRRVEESMMKKLKGAGADTGKFNRTMRPLWKKQQEKFEGSFQKSMKRPDFGLRQTPKLRDASDAISHRPGRRLPLAGPDDYKPRVIKKVPAIKGVPGTGPQWSINQQKFESALARYDFGDRARNPAGQYSSGYEVSADDMADAYGAKRKKKAALLVGAGGATLAAAMAGRKYAPQMARSVGPAIGRVLRSAVM